jgi:3-hydroxyacyl-[acyl-carrier-protein] dehydratase
MRWFWIDRFTEFVCTQRAMAIKTVSLSEEHVHDYVPGFPMMSVSFVVEGIAQTGGLLVGQTSDWRNKVVLAKAPKVVFHDHPRPGDCLRYTTVVENLQRDGAIIRGTSHIDDRLQAEVEIVFAYLDDERFGNVALFPLGEFAAMLRMLRVFNVGKHPDGTPLLPPEYLATAEQALAGSIR